VGDIRTLVGPLEKVGWYSKEHSLSETDSIHPEVKGLETQSVWPIKKNQRLQFLKYCVVCCSFECWKMDKVQKPSNP
jgi:hypothetical protein